MKGFADTTTKARAREVVHAIEGETAAEIVIVARPISGAYAHVDLAVGAVLALATLVFMMYADREWPYWAFPLDVTLAFAFGALATHAIVPFRRVLVSKKRLHENVARAAKASFVDHGVHRTHGRWGVLVYVSRFERRAEVVTDVGIDVKALGDGWSNAIAAMNEALAGGDLERFFTATRALGPILGAVFPHRADDVDELPDEPDAA